MGKWHARNLPGQIIGFGACFLSLYFLAKYREELPIAAASIYFFIICATDTLKKRIPNVLNLGLLFTGLTLNALHNGWHGILQSLLGLALGIGLLLLPYAMGGFGAGDVKALGALGSLTGPTPLIFIFIYMAFYGGALAILHYMFNNNLRLKICQGWTNAKTMVLAQNISHIKPEKVEPLRFPYAAAIAFGYYSYITWGAFFI